MGELRRFTPEDMARLVRKPSGTSEGTTARRPLAEVERPYSEEVQMQLRGDMVMVNDEIILSYNRDDTNASFSGLYVTREMTKRLVSASDTTPVLRPYVGEELASKRGKLLTLYMTINRNRPRFYIGEEYEVVLKQKTIRDIAVTINAVSPITLQTVEGNQDPIHVLKRKHEHGTESSH